ncbi:MAG TPA: hypothetical protein VF188_12560 [Longimicrobiales bacterium]
MATRPNEDRERREGAPREPEMSSEVRAAEGGVGERGAEAQEPMERVKEQAGEVKERAEEMGGRMKERAGEFIETRKSRMAGRIDRVGERLERKARSMSRKGGLNRPASRILHKAGDTLEDGAEYLRTHDLRAMGSDISGGIRRHPMLSVGAAFGAGLLVGRAMGGGEEREEEEREKEKEPRHVERPHEHGPLRSALTYRAKQQLGHALVGAVGAMMARRVRERVAGEYR